MDRRSPALHGDRRRQRRAARHVLSRHVSARRKVQSLRRIRNHRRQTVARWKISAANGGVALQFPAAERGQAVADDATAKSKRSSTNSVMRSMPSRRAPNMCVSPARMSPVDFVEAPSQMLQNWVWDKKVLDTFAADYRDPSKKIPAETIKKMNDAKLATAGVFYRRQFAFASLDLALHDPHPEECALRLRRDVEPDSGEGFSADRSEHDLRDLLRPSERLRRRLLRLRLGGCDRGRHGDGFREGARTGISTSKPACDCATKSTNRAIRAT